MRTVYLENDAFRVFDEGIGPPLLFVHGFPLDHRMWAAQLDRFKDRYRVIAPDLRCFGESVAGVDLVTMEMMADDLNRLLDALEVTQPVIYCGLSMGGYVGWQFYRKYASRIRALILADTRSKADSAEALQSRAKMVDHLLRAGTQYVAEPMLPKLFAPDSFRRSPGAVAQVQETILSARPQSVAAAIRGLSARPDMTGLLPEIKTPTLLIVGEEDTLSSPDEMRAMAGSIPHARFEVIPQAGHLTPMENPTAFNAAVEKFLGGL